MGSYLPSPSYLLLKNRWFMENVFIHFHQPSSNTASLKKKIVLKKNITSFASPKLWFKSNLPRYGIFFSI